MSREGQAKAWQLVGRHHEQPHLWSKAQWKGHKEADFPIAFWNEKGALGWSQRRVRWKLDHCSTSNNPL